MSLELSAHSICPSFISPFISPGNEGAFRGTLDDKCREQYPLRWDSFVQPSFEHSLRHCLPLNFFLIPLGVETTSPFLYFWFEFGDLGVLALLQTLSQL